MSADGPGGAGPSGDGSGDPDGPTRRGEDDPDEPADTGQPPPESGAATPDDRLLLDAMLGKLATYLRMCGYDAAYAPDRGVEADDRLRALAAAEGRRLLTRDRELADRTPGALLVTARDVTDQLREFRAAGYDLALAAPPARCGACNGRLDPVPAGDGTPDGVPDPGAEAVRRCRACGQHFWKGSHWADVRERLREL